jgi:hypothetical protein
MKYKKGIKSSGISKNDIIDVQTSLSDRYSKYLVVGINMSQKYLDLLPIDNMVDTSNIIGTVPVMSMPFNIISKIKKDNKTSILFLLNQDNPHIMNAIFAEK